MNKEDIGFAFATGIILLISAPVVIPIATLLCLAVMVVAVIGGVVAVVWVFVSAISALWAGKPIQLHFTVPKKKTT
jgi:hypothetical protein